MRKITVTGKTVEEAIESGLEQLELSRDRVKVSVIEEAEKPLFGLFGGKDAIVELTVIVKPVEEAEAFLENIFHLMGLDITMERERSEHGVVLHLNGPEIAILIGRRGQTLDALQYLVTIIANKHSLQHVRILLDAENFRSRREKTLQQLALRLAQRVVKTGNEVVIEPMPANERKIIHAYLQNHPNVTTYSKGEEPSRRVVIQLK